MVQTGGLAWRDAAKTKCQIVKCASSQGRNLIAERSSEWVLEQLYAIVNARYEDRRAILLTTNLDPEELREQITPRTVSRLVEICGDPLPLFGEDQRIRVSGG